MGRLLPDRRLRTLSTSGPIPAPRRASRQRASSTERNLRIVVEALDAHKAIDVVVLDLRSVSDAADYFVIASGSSDTHVRTLVDRVAEAARQYGWHPHHVEGTSGGRWALLDFVDVVVHVFHPTLRAYYQLERLWADAPSVDVETLR